MISATLLHTTTAMLKRAGLTNAPSAAAVLALHLAALPPEPETWGDGEPMSSADHLYAEIVEACRMLKTIGWALDPMAVAALAAESVVRKHEDWHRAQMQGRCEARIYTWITEMDRTPRHPSAEALRDLAGVATAAIDDLPQADDGEEPEANADGTAEAAQATEPEAVNAPAPETGGGVPPVADADPPIPFEPSVCNCSADGTGVHLTGCPLREEAHKPRKPRCPQTYEGIDGTAVPCGRPVGHKPPCGPAKVVGKKA